MTGPEKDPIVIVGGGFAGTAALVHLLLRIAKDETITPASPVRIKMVERLPEQLHGGIAYGKGPDYKNHNINIGSKRIDMFRAGEKPPGFTTFFEYIRDLSEKDPELKAHLTNPPRQLLGEHLQHTVNKALELAGGKAEVEFVNKRVTDLEEKEGGAPVQLLCNDGTTLGASHVLLATGFRDTAIPPFARAVRGTHGFLEEPYSKEANAFFDMVVKDKEASVMIVGTGLTSMDIAARLIRSGHQGKITMISRRALMHKPYEDTPPDEYLEKRLRGEPRPASELPFTQERPKFLKAKTLKGLVRGIVREFKELNGQGYTSEEILGYWERFTPDIVEKFPDKKKELAELFAANEILITTSRVGVTPDIGRTVREGMRDGRIEVISATVDKITETADDKMEVAYTPGTLDFDVRKLKTAFHAAAQGPQKKVFDYVFSGACHNNNYDVKPEEIVNPLWRGLIRRGKSVAHWTRAGVALAKDLSLLDKDGKPSEHVSVIGVPAAGFRMVTPLPYFDRDGAGGRVPPPMMGIAGILDTTAAFLAAKYDRITAPFRAPAPANANQPAVKQKQLKI